MTFIAIAKEDGPRILKMAACFQERINKQALAFIFQKPRSHVIVCGRSPVHDSGMTYCVRFGVNYYSYILVKGNKRRYFFSCCQIIIV